VYVVLYSFGGSDGGLPVGLSGPMSDGNFYGTTVKGGTHDKGAIYRISPSGEFTLLYSFSGPDGAEPQGSIVQGSDGSFYGATRTGGAQNKGTIFAIKP
jgi:uncharacterized repeat protein (TIGR03803 family)